MQTLRLSRKRRWPAVVALAAVCGGGCERSAPLELGSTRAWHAADAGRSNPVDEPPDVGAPEISEGVACFLQVAAICERNAVCRRLSAPAEGCLALARDCPTAFLLAGSTRTKQGLIQCAEEYQTFSCESFLRGEAPACASPGTLAAGQVCGGHMACQSLYCARDSSGERTCYALASSGGACPERSVCPQGESCEDGACERVLTPSLDSGDAPQSAVDEPCYETSFCQEGLYCRIEAAGELGTCQVPPKAGEPCAAERAFSVIPSHYQICDLQSYCQAGVCYALPALDEPCAQRSDLGLARCQAGATCDTTTLTCRPQKAAGEACAMPTAFSTSTGLPLAPECDSAAGLRCLCEADTTSCEVGVCHVVRYPGESCGGAQTRCLYGSACLAGSCDYPARSSP